MRELQNTRFIKRRFKTDLKTLSTTFSIRMEFITFVERNNKECEVFLSYLQYTGNESELQRLEKFMRTSKTDLSGSHYSDFQINLDVRFSADVVNQMCKLPYGQYSGMFEKVAGKFKFPPLEDTNALRMDELFGGKRISMYTQVDLNRCIYCDKLLEDINKMFCTYACKVEYCGCKGVPSCCGEY